MIVTIDSSALSASILVPASKSVTQRLFALALMHPGKTVVQGHGQSKDELAALELITQLGAKLQKKPDESLVILGSKWFDDETLCPPSISISCGESGLSMRMFTPIASLLAAQVTICASGSLQNRPMHFFEPILQPLGVQVASNVGLPPVRVTGPLVPADISLDGALSSQFLTGVLLALGRRAKIPLTVTVSNLKSRPYITLTLQMMQQFGYNVSSDNYESFKILPATTHSDTIIYRVEGDWSGASFLLVAGALHGNISLLGLNLQSVQADKAILDVLKMAGADLQITNSQITTQKSSLQKFDFDAGDCPDLFPPLVVLALSCKGISSIKGVGRLLHKESNRAEALQMEFEKMGANISINEDTMYIQGPTNLIGADLDAHGDHRIAMALAVAALGASGSTTISGAESVQKSYPAFFEDLQIAGARIHILK